jgi:hypothetical protein
VVATGISFGGESLTIYTKTKTEAKRIVKALHPHQTPIMYTRAIRKLGKKDPRRKKLGLRYQIILRKKK